MGFEAKRQEIISDIKELVRKLIEDNRGVESKQFSKDVLIPDEDYQFNLGTHYNGYVTEVTDERLFSNEGNSYFYEQLSMEQICEIADNLENKYGGWKGKKFIGSK